MKPFTLFIFILTFSMFSAQHTHKYRILINNAEKSSSSADEFLNYVQSQYQQTKRPIFKALTGVGYFFQAKHSYSPFTKMSYFRKGKELLDDSIREEPGNLEMRLLRYLSQLKSPAILGYKHNMKEDKQFLRQNYKNSKDEDLIKEIKKVID